MNKKTFKKIWDKCAKERNEAGQFSIDDWSAMCHKLDEVSKELGLPTPPEDGYVIDDPSHRAFLEGAKWGFVRAMKKSLSKESLQVAGNFKAKKKS